MRPRRIFLSAAAALAVTLTTGAASPRPEPNPLIIQGISWREFGLVIKASAPLDPQVFTLREPDRFVIDLPAAEFADTALSRPLPVNQGTIKQLRLGRQANGTVRLVLDCSAPTNVQLFQPGDRTTLVIVPADMPHPKLAEFIAPVEPAPRRTPEPPTPSPVPWRKPAEMVAPSIAPSRKPPDLLASAEQAASKLAEIVQGNSYGWQDLQSVWAQEGQGVLKLRLKASKPLTYLLFQESPNRLQVRIPGGRFAGSLPSEGRLLARAASREGDGSWTLDLALAEGTYQLGEELSPERNELTLSWERILPRRFAERPLIVIDPGHGGADPGAVGPTGITEKAVNLGLGKALQQALQSRRINALMTRSADTELYLAPRVNAIEAQKADLFISLHANSHVSPGCNGTETFWRESASRAFAEKIHQQVTTLLQRPNRGVKQERLYVLRHPSVPSILLETGFISNAAEEKMLADPAFQAQTAAAIATGIEQYLTSPDFLTKKPSLISFNEK